MKATLSEVIEGEKPFRYDFFFAVRRMMDYANQSRGRFNARQYCLYTGLQLEELHEKMLHLFHAAPSTLDDPEVTKLLSSMLEMAGRFRNGIYTEVCQKAWDQNAEALLDDDVDQMVVTVGAMETFGGNVQGALQEVTDANLAKFPNGKATIDANGKIVKPEGWQPPNLAPFTGKA